MSPCARVVFGAALVALSTLASPAAATADDTFRLDHLELRGNARTRVETIEDLLPRRMPAVYTNDELRELERRVNNLEIFDEVTVTRRGDVLAVKVREKWTLIPNVELSTGNTAEDLRALVGATEYNVLGTANQLSLRAFRAERGWGAGIGYREHEFRRRHWALGVEGGASTASYRFENGSAWNAFRTYEEVTFTSPPIVSPSLNVRAGGFHSYEASYDRILTDVPGRAHSAGTILSVVFNRYEFRDLVPRGLKAEVTAGTGFLSAGDLVQPRHYVEGNAVLAIPVAKYTVLMGRVAFGALTRGNANFSYLVGSIEGVRGLEDNLYRNWLQVFSNVELRQGLPIARRWALQGIVFVDGAVFERFDENGRAADGVAAVSTGIGARLVPTWLASFVLRADVAYLVTPTTRPFVQLGLKQYF